MEQLLAYMQKEHLDGMFISRPGNVKYVSHYTGEDSWLFITEQEKFFLTDPRYTEQVSYECPDYTILNWRDTYGSIGKALAYAAEKVGAKTIGYEASHLTVEQYQKQSWYRRTASLRSSAPSRGRKRLSACVSPVILLQGHMKRSRRISGSALPRKSWRRV